MCRQPTERTQFRVNRLAGTYLVFGHFIDGFVGLRGTEFHLDGRIDQIGTVVLDSPDRKGAHFLRIRCRTALAFVLCCRNTAEILVVEAFFWTLYAVHRPANREAGKSNGHREGRYDEDLGIRYRTIFEQIHRTATDSTFLSFLYPFFATHVVGIHFDRSWPRALRLQCVCAHREQIDF